MGAREQLRAFINHRTLAQLGRAASPRERRHGYKDSGCLSCIALCLGRYQPLLHPLRCYGASGDEIASVGGLLTERWHPSALLKPTDGATSDGQADQAAEAAQRPEPFAYTV